MPCSVNLDDPPIISEISSEPEFAGAWLIAETWDVAAYQFGRRFPGFAWYQWNGRFREDVRAFLRGDEDMVNALITRVYGSDDLFPDTVSDAYHAYQGVNFVDSHDGFNLYDLVAYNDKHNQPNGHDNADGPDANYSWNCGFEGDDGAPPEVLRLRTRQAKNFCALLMLANGTPMFCAGDEFLHTQRGNSNSYNQDNETTWLDWNKLDVHHDATWAVPSRNIRSSGACSDRRRRRKSGFALHQRARFRGSTTMMSRSRAARGSWRPDPALRVPAGMRPSSFDASLGVSCSCARSLSAPLLRRLMTFSLGGFRFAALIEINGSPHLPAT